MDKVWLVYYQKDGDLYGPYVSKTKEGTKQGVAEILIEVFEPRMDTVEFGDLCEMFENSDFDGVIAECNARSRYDRFPSDFFVEEVDLLG